MKQAYLNGTVLDETLATVSVDDRGFRFGDGVFETIRVEAGLPYLWEEHLERLRGGLEALRIKTDTGHLLSDARKLLIANQVQEGLLRVHISRGAGSRGYLPAGSVATIVMQTLELPQPAQAPARLWLSSYEKISPRALPVQFKLAQGLNSTLARMEAVENGCDEALLLSREGHVSEASSNNIFWRRGNTLYTPSPDSGALAGITRRRILELSPWPVQEGLFTLADLAQSEAVILTNAAMLATPVAGLTHREKQWDSIVFASEINALIKQDVLQYTRSMRELLA